MDDTLRSIEATESVGRAFQVDVCNPHELGVTVREVLTTMGSPELLVNVAGVAIAATVLDTSDQEWSRVINTNLTGPFLLTRAILPLMLDRGSGVIVNVASVAGAVGLQARAAYCASKAGLVGLTRAVAADYAQQGIRCIAVCPGTVGDGLDRVDHRGRRRPGRDSGTHGRAPAGRPAWGRRTRSPRRSLSSRVRRDASSTAPPSSLTAA